MSTRKVALSFNKHASADELLPVRNMTDWGCSASTIRPPRYADRAFVLCSQVRVQPYQKIAGQINDGTAPPTMLDKQSHKASAYTLAMAKAAPEGEGRRRATRFFAFRSKER